MRELASDNLRQRLREVGLRATPARIAVARSLMIATEPLTRLEIGSSGISVAEECRRAYRFKNGEVHGGRRDQWGRNPLHSPSKVQRIQAGHAHRAFGPSLEERGRRGDWDQHVPWSKTDDFPGSRPPCHEIPGRTSKLPTILRESISTNQRCFAYFRISSALDLQGGWMSATTLGVTNKRPQSLQGRRGTLIPICCALTVGVLHALRTPQMISGCPNRSATLRRSFSRDTANLARKPIAETLVG